MRETDVSALPVLDRQSFALLGVTFLDRYGVAYTPSAGVQKRVVTNAGDVLTDWTTLAGFVSGDDIQVTADELELQDATQLTEKHIILIVGNRTLPTEHPLRVIVQVKNRELQP